MNNLESIFNSIDEGLLILSPEGDIMFFNQEMEELHKKLGWPQLGLSENILQLVPPESGKRIGEALEEVKRTKETHQLFADKIIQDSTPIHLEATYVPALEEGKLVHICILIRDITVSKIVEKRILGMANDLRTLIDKANAVIIATDSRGYITEWNDHDSFTTGYHKNEVLAQKMSKLLIPAPEQPAFQELLNQVLSNKPVTNAEIPILSKKGDRLIFLLNATTRTNAAGQIIGVIFIGQDITERRKIEQEFKFAHERLLFHLENGPLGFIEWDATFHVKSWTKRAEEIFGWKEKEIIENNKTAFNQVYSEDKTLVENIGNQLLQGKVDRNQVQNRNLRKDGSVIWCEWFNSVQRNPAGKVEAIMSLVQDVTSRKENELHLQEAVSELEAYKKSLELKVEERTKDLMLALKKEKDVVEMKSRFVSVASHEFRTPLTSIQHATGVIRRKLETKTDPALIDKLNDIEKQARHMMHLLDDVLTYGKSEAGKIKLVVSRINLQNFLEKIIEDVGNVTKNTHRIQIQGMPIAVELNIDEKLLRNILINLLTNAIKYSPGKKKVFLEVHVAVDFLQFKVTDKGIGIPPEEHDKIFDAFVRGLAAESIQGSGLGLSIVKKAVELLKGNIQLESNPGVGSTFTVTLPIIEHNQGVP
jgi:PAS domain S-box-containing protein